MTERERERRGEKKRRRGSAAAVSAAPSRRRLKAAAAVECVPIRLAFSSFFSPRRLSIEARSPRSFAPPSPWMTLARSHLHACESREEIASNWRSREQRRSVGRKKKEPKFFLLTDDAGLPQRKLVEEVARGVLVLVLDGRRRASDDLGASGGDEVERVLEREGAGGLQ